MPYKKGDEVEIVREGTPGLPVGTIVTVMGAERITVKGKNQWTYKVDRDVNGRKWSRYVASEDLVKRKNAPKEKTKTK